MAEIVWRETYDESIELYNKTSLAIYLVKDDMWNTSKEDELNRVKDNLDEAKVQIYKNRHTDKTVTILRAKIDQLNAQIATLLGEKHHYDHFTAEFVADQAKERFLVGCSLWPNRKKHWREPLLDYKRPDELVEQIMLQREVLSESDIRSIARSGQFRQLNLRRSPIHELQEAIQWHSMYNSIYKHPECPEEFVFDDDDMMDGWVILQRRKSEKNKLEKKAESIASRHKNAGDIFIQTGQQEDGSFLSPEDVLKMNSEEGLRRLKERSRFIKEKGTVHEIELPDVRQELEMKLNSMPR